MSQDLIVPRPPAARAYVIETERQSAGLAMAEEAGGFRFLASSAAFVALDGLLFGSVAAVERAVVAHEQGRWSAPAQTVQPSPPGPVVPRVRAA